MSDLIAATLVLNKGYSPIHIKPVADAICDVVSSVGTFVEHEKLLLNGEPNPFYYNSYTRNQWARLPISMKLDANGKEEYFVNLAVDEKTGEPFAEPALVKAKRIIHGSHGRIFRAPFIMRHNDYNELPDMEIRRTRKNIWLRDSCKCQYCGEAVTLKEMTLDHVKPKADKGGDTWGNLVTACFECNLKKGKRAAVNGHVAQTKTQPAMNLIGWTVPDERGNPIMTYVPSKPKWYPLFARFSGNCHEEWEDFLPEAAKNRPPTAAIARKNRKLG